MSGNVALRNRRRRDHAAHTGGKSRPSSVVSVERTMPLSAVDATERAKRAVRDATGVEIADDGCGSLALGMFSELVVDVDVTSRGDESAVRVELRTEGRNTALALLMLALAVLSVVGIVIYALVSRGDRGPRARLQKMAAKIEASLAEGSSFGNPSLGR
jgi:hypothetical protein